MFGPFTEDFESIFSMIMRPQLAFPSDPLKLARFGAVVALPATALARALGSAEARALFLGVAAHAFRPLQSPGSSAVGITLISAAHANGWPVAIGGSAATANAIIARCMERGVKFETGRRVRSIRELGQDVDVVMLDTSPGAAAEIIGDKLPSGVRRAYKRFRHGPAAFKVDFAIEGGRPVDPRGVSGVESRIVV